MRTAILIDNNVSSLQALEKAIHVADPSMACVSLVFADQAIDVIEKNLKTCPNFIFLNLDVQKNSGIHYLNQLRKNKNLRASKIVILSSMLPPSVMELFKTNGADFVFQTPITPSAFNEITTLSLGQSHL